MQIIHEISCETKENLKLNNFMNIHNEHVFLRK